MKSSIQIHNELLDLDNKIADAQAKFNAAEAMRRTHSATASTSTRASRSP